MYEIGDNMSRIVEEAIQKGREEAWELAKKIARGEIDFEWIKSLGIANPDGFGWMSPLSIGIPKDKDIPINDLLESYNTWEKNKVIKRWDEVYSKSTDLKFVVTRIGSKNEERIYEGFNASGGCYEMLPTDVVKTGRSFPELAAVIERMNEDD